VRDDAVGAAVLGEDWQGAGSFHAPDIAVAQVCAAAVVSFEVDYDEAGYAGCELSADVEGVWVGCDCDAAVDCDEDPVVAAGAFAGQCDSVDEVVGAHAAAPGSWHGCGAWGKRGCSGAGAVMSCVMSAL
jgi:hypothetical protein